MPRVTNADTVEQYIHKTWLPRKTIWGSVSGKMTSVAFAAGLLALHRQGRIEVGYMKADGTVQVATPRQGKPPTGTELAYRIKA